jgi:hypothetical protein
VPLSGTNQAIPVDTTQDWGDGDSDLNEMDDSGTGWTKPPENTASSKQAELARKATKEKEDASKLSTGFISEEDKANDEPVRKWQTSPGPLMTNPTI